MNVAHANVLLAREQMMAFVVFSDRSVSLDPDSEAKVDIFLEE
jgi:hypothetical protein